MSLAAAGYDTPTLETVSAITLVSVYLYPTCSTLFFPVPAINTGAASSWETGTTISGSASVGADPSDGGDPFSGSPSTTDVATHQQNIALDTAWLAKSHTRFTEIQLGRMRSPLVD